MTELIKVTLLGFLAGCVGTGVGGVLTFFITQKSNRFMSFILELSAGLMMSVVSFELLPEAFSVGGIYTGLFGIVLGVVTIIILENQISYSRKISQNMQNSFMQTAILILVGVAIHNFPEGLAIGSAFDASKKLGISLVIIIGLHNIPEGFAIGLPMKVSGIKNLKILYYTIASGLPMGIGAFVGNLLGTVSKDFICVCLGFAGGAMLYIICGELIPKSKSIYKGRFSSLGNILGIILGILISQL